MQDLSPSLLHEESHLHFEIFVFEDEAEKAIPGSLKNGNLAPPSYSPVLIPDSG